MTCKKVSEHLPWLLNQTLAGEERARVVAHLARCADCRQELAETLVAFRAFGQHPTAAELVDLAFDQPLADPALIERHLLACDACAGQTALLRQSRALEAENVVPLAPPARPALPETGSGQTGVSRHWRAAAVAAGLVAVVGAGGWLRSPEVLVLPPPQVAAAPEQGAVTAGAAVVERLVPKSNVTRGSRDTVVLGPEHGFLTLELERPDDLADYPAYLASVVGAGGSVIVGDIPFDNSHDMKLSLGRGLLVTGDYLVRLYGIDPDGRELVDEYRLTVELVEEP